MALTEKQKKRFQEQLDNARQTNVLIANQQSNVNNQSIQQRVQARYEANMRQAEAIKNNTYNNYKVDYSQKMNTNNSGYRSTANKNIKSNTFEVKMKENGQTKKVQLPTKQSVLKNKGKLPVKYEEDKTTKENKAWYKRILQKPEILKDNLRYFEDGYDVGDIAKTYKETKNDIIKIGAGTVADVGLGITKGVTGIGEGIGKAISGGVAQVADWTGHDEYAKKVRNRLAGREKGAFDEKYLPTNLISSAQNKVNKASIAGEYADKASENIGYMAGLMAVNYVAPGSDTAVMFLNSTGNSLAETYAKDENVEDWQAWTKAIGSGAIETAVEKTSGLLGGKGIGEKMTGKIASKISSGAGKSISKLLGMATDEGIEEFESYISNYGLDRVIDSVSQLTGSDVKFSEDWNWEEVGEAIGLAFATTFIMGGSNIQSDIKNENASMRNEIIENSNLGPNSKEQLKRLSEKNNWTVENLKNMLEQGGNLNNQDIAQNGNLLYDIDRGVIKKLMGQGSNYLDASASVDTVDNVSISNNIISQNANNMQEQNKNLANNQQAKMAENGNAEQIIVNEDLKVKIPGSNYKFEASGNQKVDNLRQDANKYFNNSEKAKNYVGMLEKIITDKNIDIRLDANLKTLDGKIANGSYSNGVITINPNSTKTGEFIAVHELTHAIGTKDMLNIVENYRKSNSEFNSAVEGLLQNYNTTELTEEALSDVSAQLFGNQEFINNIAQNNPNIFQKIYSEIKYLWHQFRGYKNQNQFVEDLYYKWTQAYNNNTTNSKKSSYSIQADGNGNKYVKVDTDQDIFEGKSLKEQTKIAQEYILNNFREKGLLKNDTNINISRKTANEYTHPRNGLDNTTYSSKMKASTELDNLLKISQFIKSEADDGRHVFAKDGWDYYETVFKVGDKTYSGWLNIANGKNGKLLYDITNIKERASNYSVKTVSVANSSINNSIPSSNKDVNTTTTKYSIQESENNSGSFSLEERVSGDRLLNAQDLIAEIKSVGAKVDDNGYVTVYHQTTQENADNIRKSGKMSAKEDGIFFSTSKDAQQSEGRGNVKLEFKIPAEELELDDIFDNNADLRIPLKNKNQQLDISKYLVDNSDTRYSQNNETWQSYLDKNYKATGTTTKFEEITQKNVQNEGSFLLPHPKKNVSMPMKMDSEEAILKVNISDTYKTNTKKQTENKVAEILSKPLKQQKESDRKWAILASNILDKGLVFENMSLKVNNRELQAKWDYSLLSQSVGQNAIGNSRYEFKDEKQIKICKGLSEIIEEVGAKSNDFQNYMYHQLNIDRMTLTDRFGIDNKPVFGDNITADYSKRKVAEFEEKNPEFKKWAKDVYDYANADKSELVKNGVISQELSDKFAQMYPHYIPIKRVGKKGNAINVPLDTGRTGINSPIKRATGGSLDINPLFETMAERTLQTYRASARNSLGIELKNTLQVLNELNADTNQESLDNIIESINDEDTNKTLLTEGTKTTPPTFTIFQNGEKITFDINKDIYDALKPKDSNSLTSKTFLPLNKISNIRRGVLTEFNPVFMVTNAIKDAQDILINSQHAIKTYAKIPEAYAQIISKGYWYNEYVQNGGEQNTYFKEGEFEKVKEGKLPKAVNVVTIPFKAISKVNNVIEMAPRLAEYIASRESGRSIQTSMLDASRVTTNFKAGGDVTKFINRNGATFLNAGVQGTMQAVRNIREANAQGLKGWAILAGKTIIAGTPALLLNHLLWGDDDDYNELQDYVKDNYYIIGKIGDNQFLRIPKGRVVSVIQKVIINVDDYINNKQELNIDNVASDIWEDLKFGFDNVAPNNPIENNVLSPIIQAITNTSWYGEDIVPSRLQKLPSAEQYDESTDKFSKWLGEKTGVSPKKINYLLDQYTGGVGDVLLPLGTPQAENNVIEDKFTTDSTMKSKYPGEFFEKIDKLEINKNSSNATDSDKVKYKYMSSISGEMSELYKKKREIQNSELTDEEKKKELKNVQKEINTLARTGIETVDKIQTTNTTAIIGDKQYYKQVDEWKELTDEEKEKNKNISLKTYSDYKTKIKQNTEQKQVKMNDEDAQLNNNEKIKLLQNSTYSTKEKDALYSNYIMSKSDDKATEYEELKEYYANNSVLGSKNYRSYDIIDQYLDYKVKADDKIKELRANGTKKENENLTEIEKIQVLKGSGYNNAQTEALYSTVVAEERGHKIYEELKKLNGGNSIQSYMTFMLSDRESEKEDDGTLSGKSISGSKLHKVQNTLKGMGQLNTISKIYLEATQSGLKKYASKDYEILKSYLNKATEEEQTIIMETIQGTTKMKNGKYKY